MNERRRKRLNRAINLLNQARDLVDAVRDEESDAMSNMPENFQDTERYEKMENAVDNLDEAIDNIDEAISQVESASE